MSLRGVGRGYSRVLAERMKARARAGVALAVIAFSAQGAEAQNPFDAPAPSPPAANPFGSPMPPAAAPTPPAPAASDPFGAPSPSPFGAPSAPATPGVPAASPPTSNLNLPSVAVPPPSGGYRVLAPGVETTIPSPVTAEDRSSRHDLVEILTEDPEYGVRPWAPNVAPAKNVHFTHDVWGLDFTFKPIRFLRVPGPGGKERLIWYLVYRVRNTVEKPFLFIPHFELQSYDVNQTYPEKLLPDLVPLIQRREDKNRKLLNTLEMTGELPAGSPDSDRGVWGVVTWEGIDPRTDRFSIYVQGLTNAYRWEDEPGAYQKGDAPGKGRKYQSQVLKINFWRPSDARDEHEDEIRLGIPGDVDYAWSYK